MRRAAANQTGSMATSALRARRGPSRCQLVWQGILILATLALAIAANAQLACYDVFANRNAPLRPGNSIVLKYRFADAKPLLFKDPVRRLEVLKSADLELQRLHDEGSGLRLSLQALVAKNESRTTVKQKTEIQSRLQTNTAKIARVTRIAELARRGRTLERDDVEMLSSQTFTQTIVLNKKSDTEVLKARIAELEDGLATVDEVNLPPNRYQRAISYIGKHGATIAVLVTIASAAGGGVYQLYLSHQKQDQGKVTELYFEGNGTTPITAPAQDNRATAIPD